MRFRFVSTAASLLAVTPGVSLALGLGEIQLRSTLNAPLNADIELTATPEELASLRPQIASRDAFSRAGLEYPAFMSGIQARAVRQADGRTIIHLSSTVPMTEPFATLLVEASTAAGVFRHEYTVFFDPPSFASAAPATAPVATPVAGAGDRSSTIARPPPATSAPVAPVATAPVVSAAPRPAVPSAGTSGRSSEYTVRGGDSLSAIARKQYGTSEAERAMVAIYRGNQNAFDGNMNELRAGAVLRLPDGTAVTAVDVREAAAEVRRQSASWSRAGAATAGTAADPRLRLIPPATPAASGSSAEARTLQDQVARLEAELAESRRLLELTNADVARLKAAAAPAAPPAAPAAPGATPAQPAALPATATSPVVAEPAPVVAPPADVKPAKPAPVPVKKESGPSLLDLLTQYWYAPAGAVAALVLAMLGLRSMRRRREESADSLEPFAVTPPPPQVRDTSSNTLPLRKPFSDADNRNILVEESGTHERLGGGRQDTRTTIVDDTAASKPVRIQEGPATPDQGDPLADADFHMAYGLYDQAADLIKLAIQREPARRDLRLKLLEVFFVWGNKDQFLQTARELADARDASAPGEWEKVAIMGRQLAPDDPLFSQSRSGTGAAAGAASVDLNLEGGQNLVDFDLMGEPAVSLTSDGGVDLDLGSALHGGEATNDFGGIDFLLDDPTRGGDLAAGATSRQMAQPGFAGQNEGTQRFAVDGPTVEQPALDPSGGDTLMSKIQAHAGSTGSDQTAELSIDDLGLDLGKFDATGTNAGLLDDSALTRALEAADTPTLVASLDDASRRSLEAAGGSDHPTELLPMGTFDTTGATSLMAKLELDFDLDSNAETGRRAVLDEGGFKLDLDVGVPESSGDGKFQRTQRVEPVAALAEKDLESATMSEVGTKLDLARAYMDMGDPDGARSILREVLQEGSANQRQEAQRLIDSIPG